MELTECALNVTPNSNGSCFDHAQVAILSNYTKGSTINEIKKETNCATDECILSVIDIPAHVSEQLKRESLKTPAVSLAGSYWINNTEIDTCMSQLRKQYPGFAHTFIHMSDMKTFPPNNIQSFDYPVFQVDQIDFGQCFKQALEGSSSCKSLSTYNNVPLRSVGIVFNTDSSSGSGQHWFAVYISRDAIDPQNTSKPLIRIEVFNSAGSEIRSNTFQRFWRQKQIEITKSTGCRCEYGLVSTVKHQKDDTGNCGSYSLFYIYSRLNGCAPSEFNVPRAIVGDKSMELFRSVLFKTNQN